MRVNASVASMVASILFTVCFAVGGTLFNSVPALWAGMDLNGGEEVVKGVEIGGPSEGRICHRSHAWLLAK